MRSLRISMLSRSAKQIVERVKSHQAEAATHRNQLGRQQPSPFPRPEAANVLR
jgi:hypothetical protein